MSAPSTALRAGRDPYHIGHGPAADVPEYTGHGAGGPWSFNSLVPELLDPGCEWVAHHPWSRYTEFLEEGCDACLLVAMHAMAGVPDGVMCHTVSSTKWRNLWFNDTRVGEIGTLRALGFRRGAVLAGFMAESLLLSLVGGVMGLAAASLMQTVNISTVNFQTFSELAFRFRLTPAIALQTLLFALVMGLLGGFVPAWRAARLKIVDCLREA